MRKAGFIGFGHMGSVLFNGLIEGRGLEPSEAVVSTRTMGSLDSLRVKYPELEIVEDNPSVARKSDLVFVCVGTGHVHAVLTEIRNELREDSHLVFISGGLEIASVEEAFKGAVTKIIPTLLAEVREGITLVCHNSRVLPGAAERLEAMLAKIGEVKVIAKRRFEIASDFTSCAPGLIAAICDQLVRGGVKRGELSYEEAEAMLLGSMAGTAKLLRRNSEGFRELLSRVATAGGATEGGASELERSLPEAFDRMFTAIEARHEARKEATRRQFIRDRTS